MKTMAIVTIVLAAFAAPALGQQPAAPDCIGCKTGATAAPIELRCPPGSEKWPQGQTLQVHAAKGESQAGLLAAWCGRVPKTFACKGEDGSVLAGRYYRAFEEDPHSVVRPECVRPVVYRAPAKPQPVPPPRVSQPPECTRTLVVHVWGFIPPDLAARYGALHGAEAERTYFAYAAAFSRGLGAEMRRHPEARYYTGAVRISISGGIAGDYIIRGGKIEIPLPANLAGHIDIKYVDGGMANPLRESGYVNRIEAVETARMRGCGMWHNHALKL